MHFVCSERDSGLEQMTFYFGRNYSGLKAFPGARLTTLPNADHNITPQAAHDMVVDVIRDTVLGVGTKPGNAPRAVADDARSPQFSAAARRARA
jgi:hypothetical protein